MKLYNFFIAGLIVLVAGRLEAMQTAVQQFFQGEVNVSVTLAEGPCRAPKSSSDLHTVVVCNKAGSVASCVDALILSKPQLLAIVAADDLEGFREWFAVHTKSQQQVPRGYIELLEGIHRLANRYDAHVIVGHIRLMLENKVSSRY